jgi:hypothetical protein
MFYTDYQLALATIEERIQKAELKRQLVAQGVDSWSQFVKRFQPQRAKQPSQEKGHYGLQ